MHPTYDPATTPVLDDQVMAQLLDLDDGETGLLTEMFELYQQDMPQRLDALDEATRRGNLVGIAETAHAIKGAASTMGIPRARALAACLEAAGRKSELTPEEMGRVVAQLREAYLESVEALSQFLASRG